MSQKILPEKERKKAKPTQQIETHSNTEALEVGDTIKINLKRIRNMYKWICKLGGMNIESHVKIVGFDVSGNAWVEPRLAGFWLWNVKDLVLVRRNRNERTGTQATETD